MHVDVDGNKMAPFKRIAVNASAVYIRSLLSAGLAIFSSRWVLEATGQTDYGLLSVVGAIIIFITFINGIMAISSARYLAYSIGQGDCSEVNRWFNSAVSIHICLAVFLVLIGWPLGEYVVAHILSIPNNRLTTCLWVFRISLFSAFISMLAVPFVAMFTAKQYMTELSIWGMLYSILTFVLAGLLSSTCGDRLLYYSVGISIILVLVQVTLVFRAMIVFDECRIIAAQWFDRHCCRCMLSFAAWNLFGGTAAVLRDQGSVLLLNLFFGPSVNAAYGIALQVSNQANQLSASMTSALTPEITATEGRGDRGRTLMLAEHASKLGSILILFLAIPLIVEMDYLVVLWLKVPPPYTVFFCQLILATFLIDRLTTGYMLAILASGRIATYQATLGSCLLLTVPLAWFFLEMGYPPTSIGISFICTMLGVSIGRVLWGRRLLGASIHRWLVKVIWPTAIVALVSATAAITLHLILSPSLLRLFLVITVSVVLSLLTLWFYTLNWNEREYVKNNIQF